MSGGTARVVRRVEGERLAYYVRAADAAFWDDHWRGHAAPDAYAAAARGALGPLEEPLSRYLTREGKILEAGCGLGQYVLALRRRGYDAEGVEWAPETVASVRALHPDLPVSLGDVTSLAVPDDHYAGYISLGVVEHRRGGPEPLLREAYRVLRPGGIALISVPFFHALRRLKARLGTYRRATGERAFYQYAFTRAEFCRILKSSGFEIVATYGYGAYKGLKDEIPPLRWVLGRRLGRFDLGALAQRALERFPGVEWTLGHMLLVVCRKPAAVEAVGRTCA